MSSDSDDDSYSKIAQRLQSLKSKYEENKTNTNSLEDSFESSTNLTTDNELCTIDLEQTDINEDGRKEVTLDSIIEQNTSKITRRRGRGRGRGHKRKTDEDTYLPNESIGRVRSRSSKRLRQQTARQAAHIDEVIDSLSTTNNVENFPSPGRGRTPSRRRGRAGGSGSRPGRGRVRNSQRSWWSPSQCDSSVFSYYSVGNTDDYQDLSEEQNLFSSASAEVIVLDDNVNESIDDPLDENEELNVKVYWQSSEIHKFNIRRYQKFTQLYDYFATKENVTKEKLIFMYNDKMLNMDDTPDSIQYNICKFIDGGIINQSLSPLNKKPTQSVKGIKLKFQCQNKRKPCEIVTEADDKLSLAFMKCAEYFEKPIDKLKFYFDGDLISGKNTPKDLDLEGGECIDVVIIS